MAIEGKWARRFLGGTFVVGTAAWLLIAVLVLMNFPGVYAPAPSRIVASGGAGTWFVMGVLAFLIIGVIALGVSVIFYEYLEVTRKVTYAGARNALAWAHLVVGGGFAAGASFMMVYYGFIAGVAALPTSVGGWGQNSTWIHQNVLGPVSLPIAVLMAIALLGYLLGGIGYLWSWRSSRAK